MFLKDIAQPLVAESSSQTTSCLKSGPAYAVAQASGSAFRMTINAVFLEMNKFCARAILPMWPTDEFDKPHSGGEAYSMSFNKDQLYEVCVDDNADADEQALEEERRKLDDALFEEKKAICAIKAQIEDEVQDFLKIALRLFGLKVKSSHCQGAKLMAGLLSQSSHTAESVAKNCLAQWRAWRAIERSSKLMPHVHQSTNVIRQSVVCRTLFTCLEEDVAARKQKPLSQDEPQDWFKTLRPILESIFSCGHITTKPCEDSFAKISAMVQHNRGVQRCTMERATHVLVAHSLVQKGPSDKVPEEEVPAGDSEEAEFEAKPPQEKDVPEMICYDQNDPHGKDPQRGAQNYLDDDEKDDSPKP